MEEFVAGSVGGAAGVVVGHPFDTMKVRIQTAGKEFTGAMNMARKIMRNEGLKGFMKGITPPIASNAPINSVVFGTYAAINRSCFAADGNARQPLDQIMIAGGGAGAVGTIITSPIELLKIRLQNGNPATGLPYRGPVDCIQQIVRREGFRSLARGWYETLLRETVSFAFYFGAYEGTIRQLVAPGEQPGALATLTAGAVSGLVVWGPVYPIDVIKTRIQSCDGPVNLSPGNMLRVARDIYRKEGRAPFFRGFGTAMIRAIPVNAVTFFIYELTMQSLTADAREAAAAAAAAEEEGSLQPAQM